MTKRAASAEVMAVRTAVDRAVSDLVAGSTMLVACSGGPDSMALVGAAAWVGERCDLLVRTVTVDHALQPGSRGVADWAAEVCLRLGAASAEVVTVQVGAAGGPEAAARAARYEALEQAAARVGAQTVLLGHTRDDQAETVLLRLARGSGARSLSAMQARTGLWRRPFLQLMRGGVHAAAADLLEPLGETPWQDPHNSDPTFARVRVRALLAGLGEDLGPGVVLGLSRSAELLRDDADALEAWADGVFTRLVITADGAVSADCADLLELPRAVRTRVIRRMCLVSGSTAEELGSDHIRVVEALVSAWRGQGETRLPGGVMAARAYGRLSLRAQ